MSKNHYYSFFLLSVASVKMFCRGLFAFLHRVYSLEKPYFMFCCFIPTLKSSSLIYDRLYSNLKRFGLLFLRTWLSFG